MKLTLAQQRKLIKSLPQHRLMDCKKHCQMRQMKGDGVKEILKSISGVLGSVAKEVGPTVLRELILPFLKKKISGNGLRLAGGMDKKKPKKRRGQGLKLAGRR